jgi:outer membrane lipoprotein SlyB
MKKLMLLLAIPVALSITGCKKEGCTKSYATNYSAEAKKDNGSCSYKEDVIFWVDLDGSQALQGAAISGITLYVDGALVGSSLSNVYWTGAPNCDQQGNFKVAVDMGQNSSKTINFELKDNNGNSLYSDSYIVYAGGCSVILL